MEYRNSHTTSTKCQYHAAHSKPTKWAAEFTKFENRFNEITKNEVPIITCNPWNPVAMKKVEPNLESAIQKGASMYSNPWNRVKIIPSKIVIIRELFALLNFFMSISW